MSKKNLSKTVIEGGRTGYNKNERRRSSREERSKIKQYLHEVIRDVDIVEECVEPKREKVYKDFADKLSPMRRWLKTQVNQPWAEVHSEIKKKFDSRTTAGRHILFDHLLSSIVDTLSGFNQYGYLPDGKEIGRFYQEYFVDNEGILRETKKLPKYQHVLKEEYAAAGKWLNGRMIIEKDGILYWCYPSDGFWKSEWTNYNAGYTYGYVTKLKYYLFDNGLHQLPGIEFYNSKMTGRIHGDYWKEVESPFSFRQRGPLSQDEIKEFKLLNSRLQKDILEFSKGR